MTNLTTDTTEMLAAEREIQRTFFQYFRLVDTGEWREVASECFTPDGSMTYISFGESSSVKGREDIHKFYEDHHEKTDYVAALERSLHVAGQVIVDWADGRPTLKATVLSWHWFKRNAAAGKDRPADRAVIGFDAAEFAQIDGRWLMDRREVEYQATPVANYVLDEGNQLPG